MPNRIIIQEDGTATLESYESRRIEVPLEEHLMASARKGLAVLTPDLGPAGCFAAGLRFLQLEGNPCLTACVRLHTLNFHTSWSDEGGRLHPTFEHDLPAVNPEAMKTMLAPVPPFLEVWLFLGLRRETGRFHQATLGGILETPELKRLEGIADRRAVMLPLPNTYSDGELCTGSFSDSANQDNFLATAEEVHRQWHLSRWNRDLFEDRLRSRFESLFRWKIDGAFDPAPHADWFNLLPVCAFDRNESARKFFELRCAEKAGGR
jgi:hypothetical protein